jgi:hypothetical protein
LGGILGSVGHKVKIHKITPATGKERSDLEVKDYVVLQKPQEQDDRLPPRWEKLNNEYRSAREACISLMFVAYVK